MRRTRSAVERPGIRAIAEPHIVLTAKPTLTTCSTGSTGDTGPYRATAGNNRNFSKLRGIPESPRPVRISVRAFGWLK